MGLGNGNPKSGDKGSNHSYEFKVLMSLKQIIDNITPGDIPRESFSIDPTDVQQADDAVYLEEQLTDVMVQLITDGSYDGTTNTATLQESIDGVNYNNIEDSSGNAVEIVIDTASTTYALKTNIFFGEYLRVLFANNNAANGSITVLVNFK